MKREISEALLDFYQKVLKPDIDVINSKLSEHDERFDDIIGHFDSIYKRLERLDDEYYTIINGLKRIEDCLKSGSKQRDKLEDKIKKMKAQFNKLQARLEEIEEKVAGI